MNSPTFSSLVSVGDAGRGSSAARTAGNATMSTSSSPLSGYAQNPTTVAAAEEKATEGVTRPENSAMAKGDQKICLSDNTGERKGEVCLSSDAAEDDMSSSDYQDTGVADGIHLEEDTAPTTSGTRELTGSDFSPSLPMSTVVPTNVDTQIQFSCDVESSASPRSIKAGALQEQTACLSASVPLKQEQSHSQLVGLRKEESGGSVVQNPVVGTARNQGGFTSSASGAALVLLPTKGSLHHGDSEIPAVTSSSASAADIKDGVKVDTAKTTSHVTESRASLKETVGMLRDTQTESIQKKRKEPHTSGDSTPAGKPEGGGDGGQGELGKSVRGAPEEDGEDPEWRSKKKKKSGKSKRKQGEAKDAGDDVDSGEKRKKHKTHTGERSPGVRGDGKREKKKRKDRSVSRDRGHAEDTGFDEGDAVELTEYVKANMDKLRGMYEQQVSAATDMIAHQTEKSGLDPLSNKGTASALLAAPAPPRVPLESLFDSCNHFQKLAARKLVSSLMDCTASTVSRALSPPRFTYTELIGYAQEHCKKTPSEPNSSVDQSPATAVTPRPGQAPTGQVPTRHELIHRSASAPCCIECCPVCLNYLLVPLVVSGARQKTPSVEDSTSFRVTERWGCCCLSIQSPTDASSRGESSDSDEASEKRSSRSHRASGGWTYADQFRKFNKLKGQSHYTEGDDPNDDEYIPSSLRSSSSTSTTASFARGPSGSGGRSPVAAQNRSMGGGEGLGGKHVNRLIQGGGSMTGRSSMPNRMHQQLPVPARSYRLGGGLSGIRQRLPLDRQNVRIDRGSMFGTADQRPEKWVPRSEAMLRRLQQSRETKGRGGELDNAHSRGGGVRGLPLHGPSQQTRKARQSSSSSDSDSSSDSSSSSDEDAQKKNGRKTESRVKGGGGSDTADVRETVKTRLQKFCKQADGQKLPVLKEACAALFVTAMKDLCLEPWSQHYAIRILLRSADSVFPQFIKSNGIVLLREWMEEVATSPESVEEHEGLLASALKVLQRLRPARQDLIQSKMPFLVRAIAQRKKVAKCDFEACSEEVSAVAEKLFLTWKATFGAQASEANSSVSGSTLGPGPSSRPQLSNAPASSEGLASSEKATPERLSTTRCDGVRQQASVVGPTPRTGSVSFGGQTKRGPGGEGKRGDTSTASQGAQGAVDTKQATGQDRFAQSAKKTPAGEETKAKAEEELMSLAKLGENLQDTAKRRRLEEEGTYSPTADDEVQMELPGKGGSVDLAEEERETRVKFLSLNDGLVALVFFDPLEEPLVVKQSLGHGDELTGEEAAQHLTQLRHTQADADKFDKLRRMHTYKEIGRCAAVIAGERGKGDGALVPKRIVHPQVTMKFTVPLRIDFTGSKEPHRHPNPSPPPDPAPPGAAAIPVEPPQQLFPCVSAFSFVGIPVIASDAQGPPPLELTSAPMHSPGTVGQAPTEGDRPSVLPREGPRSTEDGDGGSGCGRADDIAAQTGDHMGLDAAATAGLVASGAASPTYAVPQGAVQAMMAPPPSGVPFFPPPCFPPIPGPGYPPLCPPFAALPPPSLVGGPPPGVFGMMPPPQGETPPFPVRPGSGPPRGGFGGPRGGRGGGRGGRGGGRGWGGGGEGGGRRRGGKRSEEGGREPRGR
ncbi:hypothetical protein CSUI_004536 [Cystoisospora suis]|uniref:TFIIS N-terminal domain-containing protein n=1 Tax=Cystoisospora suis TaxID=483139 RepID=A0A2C6KWZ1_9APIC|nr:hypothetical protein CSUI_004536 [Cystoisospora suis]